MSMGVNALDNDSVLYRTHNSHAIAEMRVLDLCPTTEEEKDLIQQLRRVLTFAVFPSSFIWDNPSDLNFFGQGLWDIGDPIYSGRPHREALALTSALIEALQAMGYQLGP
jgi:hypothetical protein